MSNFYRHCSYDKRSILYPHTFVCLVFYLQFRDNIDETVYNEENARISRELAELRNSKLKITKEYDQQDQYKERIKEIIHTINEREGLLEQFDDDIFNALVEKITILSPTHYLFTFKSGSEIDEYEE